jgi:hypothetical protein
MIETEQHYRAKTFEFTVKSMYEGDFFGTGRVGVFADVVLLIDGIKVIDQDFEMTGTVASFNNAIGVLYKGGSVEGELFVCTCGIPECTYISWAMHRSDGRILIKMENLMGDPIAKHLYSVKKATFLKAFLSMFDTVSKYMEENDIVADHYRSKLNYEDIGRMHEEISELL